MSDPARRWPVPGCGSCRRLRLSARRNEGSADLLTSASGWSPTVVVTLPDGVRPTKVDRQCAPIVNGKPDPKKYGVVDGSRYRCDSREYLRAGRSNFVSFTATITGSSAPGSVVADGGVQESDPADNTAAIDVVIQAGLPITGAPASSVAAGGTLLLALGTAAFVLGRRRRSPAA